MEITISTNEETNKQVATVAFNVPMRIYLSGERPLEEYKNIVLQNLRNDSSTIFELLEFLSLSVENNDLDLAAFCGATTVLSGIGKGLQEAVEIVEMDYKRKVIADAAPAEQARPKKEATPSAIEADAEIERIAYAAGVECARVTNALAEHTVSIMANKIGHVLSSDKVSGDIKNAVIGVMYAASNEAGVGFDDSPEIAKACFPVIMRALDVSAQRAYLHSIEHLLGESLPESIAAELKQYEVRFDTKKPHDDSAPEDSQDVNNLADLLSKVMKHPEMPSQLYNVLSNELTEVAEVHSAEDILASLKARKAEVQND
jgi:hypothetical protein